MKFTKFVKSLASEGVIYETNQILEKRWLASVSVLMAIPDTVRSVTASDIKEAPETIKRIINGIGNTVDATLEKAVMPIADGKIKDCLRVYQSEDGGISLPICNYENDNPIPDALLIKKAGMIPTDDYELVGIIFPIIEE